MPEQQMTPEQVAELKEKISKMSPEELREFQKKQCIFCQIIAGKVQSKKVYEDEKVIGILDINPSNPGHVLLMPKDHYSIMPQIPEEDITHLFMVAKALSNSCLRALGAHGTNIIVANGIAAGQKANHFMIHVIPRKDDDGLNFVLPQKKLSDKDLNDIREKLTKKIAQLTGKKAEFKDEERKPILMPKEKQNVVEAEFEEEEAEEKVEEQEEVKPKETKKVEKEKKEAKPAENKSEKKPEFKQTKAVSLDDIANLFKK